jgi:hypothetical protein
MLQFQNFTVPISAPVASAPSSGATYVSPRFPLLAQCGASQPILPWSAAIPGSSSTRFSMLRPFKGMTRSCCSVTSPAS